ncbi:DUF1330 domain-containing protein [Streptomyces sp. NPDC001601]|uniref:DUF1330 domain-containing protein n=1 Tax=Streptomyces sp. NPDC001601 TaxID=3364592 RepID=UPI00368FD7A8
MSKDPWGLEGLPTSAYVIADVQLTCSAEELAEYRSKVVATLKPYGGHHLTRDSEIEVVEGE